MKLPNFLSRKAKTDQSDEFNPFPDLTPKEVKKKKIEYIVLSTSILIFAISLSTYLFLGKSDDISISDSSTPTQQVSAAPTPTPKILPTGTQVYNYSHGKNVVGPKLTKVTLDPIDPQPGNSITITAHITHDSDVTSAKVDIITDNSSLPFDLKLIDGDESNGTWQTTAKIKDAYDYNYYIKFDLRSPTGNYEGGLKLR